MHCKAVQREPSQWKRPWHEQRGTVVLSPTHGADLATKTKTEKSSDYDTQSDTLTVFPVRDPLLHHTFIGREILCFPLLMFRNVTLYIIFMSGQNVNSISSSSLYCGCASSSWIRSLLSPLPLTGSLRVMKSSLKRQSWPILSDATFFFSFLCYHLRHWRPSSSSFFFFFCWNTPCLDYICSL